MYHCAQNRKRQRASKAAAKTDECKGRAKDQRDTFNCKGWMHVTVFEGSDEVFVKMKHNDCHVPYWDVSVPEDIKDYIRANPKLKMSDIGAELSEGPLTYSSYYTSFGRIS